MPYTVSVLYETRAIQSNIVLCVKEILSTNLEGTLDGKGLYLTVNPKLSPKTDNISFVLIFNINILIVLEEVLEGSDQEWF